MQKLSKAAKIKLMNFESEIDDKFSVLKKEIEQLEKNSIVSSS